MSSNKSECEVWCSVICHHHHKPTLFKCQNMNDSDDALISDQRSATARCSWRCSAFGALLKDTSVEQKLTYGAHAWPVQTSNILWSTQCLFRIVKSILSGKPSIQTADQQNDETARKQRRAEAVCCVTNLQYSVSPRVHCICAALMKYSEPEFRYTAHVRLFSTSSAPSEQLHSEDELVVFGSTHERRWKLKYNRQH